MHLVVVLSALAGTGCSSPEAARAFERGYAAMQQNVPDEAAEAYLACLATEPDCVPCQYEIGWAHWNLGDFEASVQDWERTLALDANHADAATWLPHARANAAEARAPKWLR